MTHEDDQVWLDTLAGRARGDSPATREAATLRDEMLRRAAGSESPSVSETDAAREVALIARARREGLLTERPGALWRWRWGWNTGFAAAAIAGLAIALGLYLRTTLETEVVRTAPDGVVRIEAADPASLKLQLIEELRSAGVTATGYELLGRQGIDADLPQPLTEDVRRVLEKHGIPPPRDGVLRVEIVPKESR